MATGYRPKNYREHPIMGYIPYASGAIQKNNSLFVREASLKHPEDGNEAAKCPRRLKQKALNRSVIEVLHPKARG